MAKCVVCTHLNAVNEAKKHVNPATAATERSLFKRRMSADSKKHPNKFCTQHAPRINGVVPTGRATGKFKVD